MNEEFVECITCSKKPGTPILCDSCVHNRNLITKLKEERFSFRKLFQNLTTLLRHFK